MILEECRNVEKVLYSPFLLEVLWETWKLCFGASLAASSYVACNDSLSFLFEGYLYLLATYFSCKQGSSSLVDANLVCKARFL